jgi:K(+)-stimulated pyrophosphate-energized sodium pump
MDLTLIAPVGALIALLFAVYNYLKVRKADEGGERVRALSEIIRKGANAYLKRQYKTVGIFFACGFALLLILSLIKPNGSPEGLVPSLTPYAFVTGGVLSGLSGFLGMKIATSQTAGPPPRLKRALTKGSESRSRQAP